VKSRGLTVIGFTQYQRVTDGVTDRRTGRICDNYRVSGALEKLEHETILQDRASDR